ncbi:MAG: STAS domain-containing protein [Aquihabitans sp.]
MTQDPPRRSLLEVLAQPGPQTVLTLSGELDPGTAPILQSHLTDLAADQGVSSVVVDLSQITFLDSSGIRALVTGGEALRTRSAELILRAPNANVRRVLEVTGLNQLLTLE